MNIVQFGGIYMNKIVVSKEIILDAAKNIAFKEGLSKINIRTTAAACGISVGSVYNYFPSKSDLVIAVIEDFWRSIFKDKICIETSHETFEEFFDFVFQELKENLKEFQGGLLRQIVSLSDMEKKKGKKVEDEYWLHLKNKMLIILEKDKLIRSSLWTKTFTREEFISFAFYNMISMLKSNKENCEFFKEIIRKTLYV